MGTLCQYYFITATATLVFFIAPVHLQKETLSIFELDLVSFTNREGRDASGGCCSGLSRPNGTCEGGCSVYLHICIQHYQSNVDPQSPCTFLEDSTAPLLNGSDSTAMGLRGLKMVFPLNFAWPGAFSIKIEAWHSSDDTDVNKILVSRFLAQRTLSLGYEWTPDELRTNQSSLEIKYRVFCATDYYGPACGQLCRPRNDSFGHYTCRSDGQKQCFPGWSGSYCQKPVCLEGCHPENGACSKPNECNCRPGWQGPYCDVCLTYPGCTHGTCVKAWQCNCDEGWGGLLCDQDLNYCTNHQPCQNGGTCTNTGQDFYTCTCTNEYMGTNCNILKNPCKENPCQNNGTCQNPSPGNYSCTCPPGFFGQRCETSANICRNNPCKNGGTCIPDPEGFTCACPKNFTGMLCKEPHLTTCSHHRCLNGALCIEHPTGPRCQCPPGLSGDRCEAIVACSNSTCQNGGTCTEVDGHFACTCAAGFSGIHCQNRLSCSSSTCANGGTCHNRSDGYDCDCMPGFGGKDCGIRLDPCSSSPCLNGASCQATANTFVCACLRGYVGVRCQSKDVSWDWNSPPSKASNMSHRVSGTRDELSGKQVALIASLSTLLPLLALLLCCIVFCFLRQRKRRQSAEDPPRTKECFDIEIEDEQLQNEINAMHMNNKMCNMPQKIVNALDRQMPAKVTNEAPPKVLNNEVNNKKIPDKSLVCAQRTFQKKENTSGFPVSCHISQEWPPCNSGGIYVIEDHFRSRPASESCFDIKDILATEV